MKHIAITIFLALGVPAFAFSADETPIDIEVNEVNTTVTATEDLEKRGGTAAGSTEASSSASGAATTTAVAVGAAVVVTAALVLGSGGSSGGDGTN